MKKIGLFALIAVLLSLNVQAQIPFSKGRIAISSDGNYGDDDDWSATPTSLMILAKAGLQDKLVLYTYSDHIWANNSPNDIAQMRTAINGSKEKWNFDKTNFIEAVNNKEAAYNAMRDVINASTEEDPLIIICAGPMQVIGTGMDRANEANRKHVTLISHSTWNDEHACKPYEWESHTGWCWEDMKTSFTNANFVHIKDQNSGGNPTLGFSTANCTDKWSYWYWMRDHSDPSVRWVYERMQASKKPDNSDAGMLWYILKDDVDGNPEKLKAFIGNEVIPGSVDPSQVQTVSVNENDFTLEEAGNTKQLTISVIPATATDQSVSWTSSDDQVATVATDGTVLAIAKGTATITATTTNGSKTASVEVTVGVIDEAKATIKYGEDFIVFEPEATESDLGLWVQRKPGDPAYYKGDGMEAINKNYLEFTGNDMNGGSPKSPLVYKFTCPKTATYRLAMRMYQPLGPHEEEDKRNDVWVKLDGDFESACPFSVEDLKHDHKFFGRGIRKWGALVAGEGHVDGKKILPFMMYKLKKGEEYTFTMSGRAQGCSVDYILFYDNSLGLNVKAKIDLAPANPEKYRPDVFPGNETPDINVTSVEINGSDFLLATIGETKQLTATVVPENATNTAIKWTSANTAIATVSASGEVTAIAPGTTKITVESLDGQKTAFLNVTVKEIVTNINTVQQHESEVKIFPNPFSSDLTVHLGSHSFYSAVLLDLSGREIAIMNVVGKENVRFSPSYKTAPAGTYLLRLIGKDKVEVRKVIRKM